MILDWILNWSRDAMKDSVGEMDNLNMYYMFNNSVIFPQIGNQIVIM